MRAIAIIMCIAVMILPLHTKIYAQSSAGEGTEVITKPLSITITPQRMWVSTFNADCGTSRKCKRMAERGLKAEKWTNTVAYAASGLSEKCSKRIRKKLLAILTPENYAKATLEFETKRTELTKKTAKYTGYRSATNVYNLRWYCLRFAIMNKLIEAIDNPTKITLHAVSADELETLARKLEDYSHRASEEYFAAGEEAFSTAKSKSDYKMAFHYFAIATQYNPKHPKAADLAEQAKLKATSSMFIASARFTNHYRNIGFAFDEEVRSELFGRNEFKRLPFFEVTSQASKAQFELRTTISKYSVQDMGQETKKHTFEKEVGTGKKDADGQEIKVIKTSNVTIYKKIVYSEAFVNWEIVSRKQGKVLAAGETKGTFTWETEWGSGSNLEIAPSSIRGIVERGKSQKPKDLIFYQKAIKANAYPLVSQILSRFIINEGSGLD